MKGRHLVSTGLLCALCAIASPSYATPEDDKIAAQEKFAEGQRAFQAGDYRLAANAFEEAYRRKPHHSPLWNAARSWQRAGEPVRAANLYVKYLREAPANARDRDVATQSLSELAAKLGKIIAHTSGPTELHVDERDADPDGVFVNPGEHTVSGHDGANVVRKSVKVTEGQVLSVTIDPLPKTEPQKTIIVTRAPPAFHLPWIVVAVGGALTLAGTGLTIWSGVDTNKSRQSYADKFANGTANQADLDDGKSRQLRTNIFIGGTIGVFVLTGVAAFFVDWTGKSKGSTLDDRASSSPLWQVIPTISSTGAGVALDARLF